MSDPRRLIEVLSEAGVSRLVLVPSLLRALLEVEPDLGGALPALRLWVCSGETFPPELARRFLAQVPGARLLNLYGSSEVAADVTYHEVREADGPDLVPIGDPIANVTAHVLDASGALAPVGVTGELYVGGVALARGYLDRAEESAARFVADPFSEVPGARLFRTGDLVRRRGDGSLEYLGRGDHQVQIRGHRVEVDEVAAVLGEHAGVASAVVTARSDATGGSTLAAYVVARGPESAPEAALRAYLRAKLPGYMEPSTFTTLPALPLLPNGKVDRQALPAPEGARSGAQRRVAPRTALEASIAGIWAELLGLEQVGVDEDFFDLGGHSLLAIRLVTRIESELGRQVPLEELFRGGTVEHLARVVGAAAEWSGAPISARPAEGPLPLSLDQEGLWFLDRLTPGDGRYNMGVALRVDGVLDRAALERSLYEVVCRHEPLRTAFPSEDGEPVQRVQQAPDTLLEVDQAEDPGDAEQVQAWVTAQLERAFDLAAGHLLRARLLRLGERSHVLALTMHHIVSDGWSVGVLYREVGALYEAFAAGRPSPLTPLPVQFADYACWQRGWLQGAALEDELGYWRETLAGGADAAAADRPPRGRRYSAFRGAVVRATVPAALRERLARLARSRRMTPYMVMLAAFGVLLHRYSGQDDIAVGSPIAGRVRPEVEDLIGMFVNTVVMRLDLGSDPSFASLLERVSTTAREAYEHQSMPFERIVRALAPARDLSRNPIFQVNFAYQEAAAEEPRLGSLDVTTLHRDVGMDPLSTSTCTRSGSPTAGCWSASSTTRTSSRRRRWSGSWRTTCGCWSVWVDAPEEPVSRLPLLDASERRRLLSEWNDTGAEYPRTSTTEVLIGAQAARTPNAVAVAHGDALAHLRRAVVPCGAGGRRRLRDLGVGPGRAGRSVWWSARWRWW